MKKLLAVSVLFALLTGAAFAQVAFSGGIETGVRMQFGGPEGAEIDPVIFETRNFDGTIRINLNGSYTHSSGTAGGNFQLRGQNTNVLSAGRNAWLWYQPMDMLRIHVGLLDGDGFGTPSRVDTSNGVGGGSGIHFRLTPMDGVRVGFTINPNGNTELMDIRFGLVYAMDGVFRAVANAAILAVGSDNVTPDPTSTSATARAGLGGMNFGFGVNILALADAGVTELSVDVGIAGLGFDNYDPNISIGQRLNFKLGDLTLTEQLLVMLAQKDPIDLPLAIRASIVGAYKIDTITAGLGVGFVFNGLPNGDPRAWDGTGIVSVNATSSDPYYTSRAEKNMGLVINPYVTFPLGGPNVTIGYGANVAMPDGGDTYMIHTVYATFGINF